MSIRTTSADRPTRCDPPGRWYRQAFLCTLACGLILAIMCAGAFAKDSEPETFSTLIARFSRTGDRSTGTPGNAAAARLIKAAFERNGLAPVGSQYFSQPVLQFGPSHLVLPQRHLQIAISPLAANIIAPNTVPPGGIEGPLIYVGDGTLQHFGGKTIRGAVVLMELDSGRNWQSAADLGARALIYIDRGVTDKTLFDEKIELTPLQFPRFDVAAADLHKLFGDFEKAPRGLVAGRIRIDGRARWVNAPAENVYALVEGSDSKLKEELIIVEAFYDSSRRVAGHSPGADEACGIASLLNLARDLKSHPPARSVLLVATGAHAQTLAGMRELIAAIRTRSLDMRRRKRMLKALASHSREVLQRLRQAMQTDDLQQLLSDNPRINRQVHQALNDRIKTRTDHLSRLLMKLRLQTAGRQQAAIDAAANRRLLLRRLGWRQTFADLPPAEAAVLKTLIPETMAAQKHILADARRQLKQIKSARALRAVVKNHELTAVISLHLSSHGDGVGAFSRGFLYPLKPTINRVTPYSRLDEVLRQAAAEVQQQLGVKGFFHDTLRPNHLKPWQSFFIDRPLLGGEVASLAGYLGISLATTNDARRAWGTPGDRPANMDMVFAARQDRLVRGVIRYLAQGHPLATNISPRNGFATVNGRVNFLRQGELFADQAAPDSVILAYQGPVHYLAMTDARGTFMLKGVADKKHELHKVIIEGYRFDPDSGTAIWAIDKKKTGKPAYRLKMKRRRMVTNLVMFACRQSTLFNLLEPRNFHYMTKIQLLDGRRNAPPLRYWFSRTDTRSSTLLSLFLEPGTPFKLTLSDTVLRKKLILINAAPENPNGSGYRIDDWPFLQPTELKVARDMWTLLAPRITNLEAHGIFDARIRGLQRAGTAALAQAQKALAARRYSRFSEEALKSWALATRVYDHVEKTQKDVLFGVLFYIALFVPFAFCAERLLFSYTNIHKRIVAFLAILLLLIAVIYKVHPAFQLAYSPTVVILAFFIIGLSLMVTLIIFFRFEEEMARLQKRATRAFSGEISPWKAFVAAFFLGVSNLRRRRLRTTLTCITLIILTFTIMSFTAVKSQRRHTRLLYQKTIPYRGFLLKTINWRDLPPETLGVLAHIFPPGSHVAARVWLENEDRTRTTAVMLHNAKAAFEARGVVGLSSAEPAVSGIDRILTAGRWFAPRERFAAILPQAMARRLNIDPNTPRTAHVSIWGIDFHVVGTFSSRALARHVDLDGEILTPVTFPSEAATTLTEVEMDALEAGEDVRSFQSRYQHVPAERTLIIPAATLLRLGGHLKGAAAGLPADANPRQVAAQLVDRLELSLFSGEPQGTFLYQASDTLSYSGMPNIIIPLAISVFIVLNTMIGSVFERKNEIAIYTSVGLAPSHVAFLFIAESLAFAVLSVVLGYLLAQVSASLFAGTALWAGITVNYSSLAGVAAMILVILVVLVSVIYPSRVAARIAIPDINRSWTLPESQGNKLSITLPFLMKMDEYCGVGGYLLDYFNSHQDVSHGIFSTGEVRCQAQRPAPDESLTSSGPRPVYFQLDARVWLAPFDLGIMQQVQLSIGPAADEPGFLEIRVMLARESGEANTWHRINRVFLNRLRRQLLAWRSLDNDTKSGYIRLVNEYRTAASA